MLIRTIISTLVLLAPLAAQAFSFTPGHYYVSTGSTIEQLDASGQFVDRIAPSGKTALQSELRGIAFGQDGLYVVRDNDLSTDAFKAGVEVINQTGQVLRSYTYSGWTAGQISSGQIAFSNDRQSFYVGALDGIYRFDVNASEGIRITDEAAGGITVMPNGDILATHGYSISRYDSEGRELGTIGNILQDPKGLTKAFNDQSFVQLVDATGIAYDQRTDTVYVSMLGYSGGIKTDMTFKVLALDGFSPTIKDITSYWYGSQMFVNDNGNLVIGSRTLPPSLFSPELDMVMPLGSAKGMFVTAMAVPEPETMILFGLGAAAISWMQARKRAKATESNPIAG